MWNWKPVQSLTNRMSNKQNYHFSPEQPVQTVSFTCIAQVTAKQHMPVEVWCSYSDSKQ